MPRYIDLDKAIERLNDSPAFPNMGMDGYFLLDITKNLLKKIATEDVAPRSEVEKMIAEIKDATFHYYDADIDKIKKKYTEKRKRRENENNHY